jgi:hypothetical protein
MKITDEGRRVGREIKNYLAVNRISREQFCFETKLGKSTVDKLITGLYSEATLQIVLERTKFVRSNSFAAKRLGGYARSAWTGYLSEYLFLQPSITGSGAISALGVSIAWDDNLPGLVLVQKVEKLQERAAMGALWIPHERSPLIYVQALNSDGGDSYGRYLILSTMVGEPVMRGLMLTVNNIVANAWVPVALPIVLRRVGDGEQIAPENLGNIDPQHPKFSVYQSELKSTLDKQFAHLVISDARPHQSAKAGVARRKRGR